jgi:hypothetical protein
MSGLGRVVDIFCLLYGLKTEILSLCCHVGDYSPKGDPAEK